MNYHLAQINIAKMIAPLDSPVMKDFVDNLDRINAIAEQSEGFVWRLVEEGNDATKIRVFEDDMIIVNMSVWTSINELMQYVYKSDHVNIFKRRKEWFAKMPKVYMAMWYVPAGTVPTVSDGVARLEYLDVNGETPYAFTFKSKFTPEDAVNIKLTKEA